MNAGQIIAKTLKLYGIDHFFAFTGADQRKPGRFELAEMNPGQSKSHTFEFEVLPTFEDNEVELDLAVTELDLRGCGHLGPGLEQLKSHDQTDPWPVEPGTPTPFDDASGARTDTRLSASAGHVHRISEYS